MKHTFPLSKGSFNGKLSEEIVEYVNNYSFEGTPSAAAGDPVHSGSTAELPVVMQKEAPASSAQTTVLPPTPVRPQPAPVRPQAAVQPAPAPSGSKFKPAVIAGIAGLIIAGAIVFAVISGNKEDSVKKDKGGSSGKPAISSEAEDDESDDDEKAADNSSEPDEPSPDGPEDHTHDNSEYTVPDDPESLDDDYPLEPDESADSDDGGNSVEEHDIPTVSVPDFSGDESFPMPDKDDPPHIYCIGENGNIFGTTTILEEDSDPNYEGRVFHAINNNTYYYELYSDENWYLTNEEGTKAFQYNYRTGNYVSLFDPNLTAAMKQDSGSSEDDEGYDG